jgi:hypothetical protein
MRSSLRSSLRTAGGLSALLVLLASAALLLLASPVAGTPTPYDAQNPPQSIYFPNPALGAFEAPFPFESGVPNTYNGQSNLNGTSINVAVILVCATKENTKFGNPAYVKPVPTLNDTLLFELATAAGMEPYVNPNSTAARMAFGMQLAAWRTQMVMTPEQVLNCNTGIGLYNDYYRSNLLIMDRINKVGFPAQTKQTSHTPLPGWSAQ